VARHVTFLPVSKGFLSDRFTSLFLTTAQPRQGRGLTATSMRTTALLSTAWAPRLIRAGPYRGGGPIGWRSTPFAVRVDGCLPLGGWGGIAQCSLCFLRRFAPLWRSKPPSYTLPILPQFGFCITPYLSVGVLPLPILPYYSVWVLQVFHMPTRISYFPLSFSWVSVLHFPLVSAR
jgi:hypothetical protein